MLGRRILFSERERHRLDLVLRAPAASSQPLLFLLHELSSGLLTVTDGVVGAKGKRRAARAVTAFFRYPTSALFFSVTTRRESRAPTLPPTEWRDFLAGVFQLRIAIKAQDRGGCSEALAELRVCLVRIAGPEI